MSQARECIGPGSDFSGRHDEEPANEAVRSAGLDAGDPSVLRKLRAGPKPLPSTGDPLALNGGFYVALAADGEYDGKPCEGFGRAVTQAVVAALS